MTSKAGTVALVTGANRGIGFEIASRLSQRGMTVILGVRSAEKGEAACQHLAESGGESRWVRIDVTDSATMRSAVTQIRDRYGRLDVLVNNAGIQIDGRANILELGFSVMDTTMGTNAFGPLLLSQACIPLMRAHGYGRIVNISSTLGSFSDMTDTDTHSQGGDTPAYRLSKTLLNGITVLLAKELAGTNILVNAVCPGWTRTDLGGNQAPQSPAEAAETPVWLATLPDGGPSGRFFKDKKPIPW